MATRRVSQFMSRKLVTLRPQTTVRDAERTLDEHGIGGAPVVDANGRLVGVVSQSDLVRVESRPVTAGELGAFYTDMDEFRDLAKVPVEHHTTPIEKVMNPSVVTVAPDTTVGVAARTMRELHIHRLLVTEGGRLVGILSALDLLHALEGEL
jgi:CBS domain-containing protein